jgi:DNA-binding transcriptional ArsR family regulator
MTPSRLECPQPWKVHPPGVSSAVLRELVRLTNSLSELKVLLVVLTYEEAYVAISTGRLATLTRQSDRTVERALSALRKRGVIELLPNKKGWNRIQLPIPAWADIPTEFSA